MRFMLIICAVGLVANANAQSDESEWKVEKEGRGITVETRITDKSPIKEFRASTVIESPLSDLMAQLKSLENHPEWMIDITHAENIADEGMVWLYKIKTPFPMKPRYIVVDVVEESDDAFYKVTMSSSEVVPEDVGNHEHIPIVEGYWHLTAIDANTTNVSYQFLSDPGLSMPDWLVNMFIVNNPYKTLKNLQDRMQ